MSTLKNVFSSLNIFLKKLLRRARKIQPVNEYGHRILPKGMLPNEYWAKRKDERELGVKYKKYPH